MVFRAIWEEQKISHAPFVMLLSPRAFQIEHLLIFLEEMFSDERDLMLELVNQNFNWACWFCHRSFLPSPVKGTEELVCSWAHSLGSAQQASSHYDWEAGVHLFQSESSGSSGSWWQAEDFTWDNECCCNCARPTVRVLLQRHHRSPALGTRRRDATRTADVYWGTSAGQA